MVLAGKRIGWRLAGLGFALATVVVAAAWGTYRSRALERDKQKAYLLFSGFAPNYTAILVEGFEAMEADTFPAWGVFPNSTAFFAGLVERCILNGATFDLFALPGVPPCRSAAPADFSCSNNAWCVVADYRTEWYGKDVPFLFTRNLAIDSLSEASAEALEGIAPYGKKGVLALYPDAWGCRVKFIPATDIATAFNPLHVTNRVLRP